MKRDSDSDSDSDRCHTGVMSISPLVSDTSAPISGGQGVKSMDYVKVGVRSDH